MDKGPVKCEQPRCGYALSRAPHGDRSARKGQETMSLLTCPECTKLVSSEAVACPACGHPIPLRPAPAKKTGLWWGLGCLLAIPALLIVVAIVGMLVAIAIPSFMRAREISQLNGCVSNMQMIQLAKEKAALALQYREGANIPESELSQFLKRDFNGLICHKGGRYTVNPVG